MVLQQRPDALRPSYANSFTIPTNIENSLYNHQLDFAPSLLSQPPDPVCIRRDVLEDRSEGCGEKDRCCPIEGEDYECFITAAVVASRH
jgi:hypothetical protein